MSSNEYSEGDLVEAVKGDTRIAGRVSTEPFEVLGLVGLGIPWLVNNGFTLTVIEKAKPKIELPTEPGSVLRGTGANRTILFRRHPVNGHESPGPWVDLGDNIFSDIEAVDFFRGKFDVLEPRAVTAKAVLQRLEDVYGEGYLHNPITEWNKVAVEFGVTNE